MSERPDVLYCFVRRGQVVHYHSDRSVFERWMEKSPWQYPPDECEIIPYVPASGPQNAVLDAYNDGIGDGLVFATAVMGNAGDWFLKELRDEVNTKRNAMAQAIVSPRRNGDDAADTAR